MSVEIAVAILLWTSSEAAVQAGATDDLPLVQREPTPLLYDPETEYVLTLTDEQELIGTDVRRRDGFYELSQADGTVLSIPAGAVAEVGIKMVNQPATPFIRTTAEDLPGGEPARLPDRDEQLAEITESRSEFQPGVIDPNWEPTSDWRNDLSLNNFNPARWYRSQVDPTWLPSSDFTLDSDVTEFRPSRWSESIIDPTWSPTDGFEKKRLFWVEPPQEQP